MSLEKERFKIRLSAKRSGLERYTPEAAESLIHSKFVFDRLGRIPCAGLVVEAEVIDGGANVLLTVEAPKGSQPAPMQVCYGISEEP